jgi:hypothetical protein
LDDFHVAEVDRGQQRIQLILGAEIRIGSAVEKVLRDL